MTLALCGFALVLSHSVNLSSVFALSSPVTSYIVEVKNVHISRINLLAAPCHISAKPKMRYVLYFLSFPCFPSFAPVRLSSRLLTPAVCMKLD